MQKNWIPQEMPRGCGIAARWLVTRRVESRSSSFSGFPVVGAGLGSPLSFARQLPVVSGDLRMAGSGSTNS